jgi:hypothetical protein
VTAWPTSNTPCKQEGTVFDAISCQRRMQQLEVTFGYIFLKKDVNPEFFAKTAGAPSVEIASTRSHERLLESKIYLP